MAARTFVLALCLFLVALLGYLTVRVAIEDGFSILVLFSLLLLGLLGVGIFGALFDEGPPRDD